MTHNLLVFLETVLFLYISFVAGATFLPHLGVKKLSAVTFTVQAILLGLGAFALAGVLLALLGIFNTFTLWIFTLALLFFSRKGIRSHVSLLSRENAWNFYRKLSGHLRENVFLKILILIWILANFSLNFVPITAHDTKDYHLPIILDIAAKGRADFTDTIEHYNFAPVLAEILYTVPVVLFGEKSAPYVFQLLQYMTLPLFLALVYDFLRKRLQWRFLALVAVLAILGIMDFQREVLHGGYVDTFTFLYGFASTLPILDYATRKKEEGGDFSELVLSAIMLGVSLGMKHFGFFFGVFNLLFLIVAFKRHSVSWREICKKLLIYVAIVFVISIFWYAKNFLWFGNPMYPMFSSDPAIQTTTDGIKSFMVDRSNPLNFLVFPFVVFGQWFVSEVETSSRLVVFGFFLLLYIFIGLRIASRQKFTLTEILLFIFIQGYLAFHFILSHYLRYFLPPIIILPALLALLADNLYGFAKIKFSASKLGRWFLSQRTLKTLCTLVFIFLFLGNLHYFQIRFSYIMGIYDQQEYIRKIGSQ